MRAMKAILLTKEGDKLQAEKDNESGRVVTTTKYWLGIAIRAGAIAAAAGGIYFFFRLVASAFK